MPPSLRRSVASNHATYLINVMTALVMAPFIVRSLGEANYGAWALTAELAGYYGMLDLGIQSAVTYYVARCTARAEHDEMDGIVSAAFWTLTAIGLFVIGAGSILAYWFPSWFMDDPAVDPAEVTLAIQLIAVMMGITLPTQALRSVLVGRERFDLLAISESGVRIFGAFCIFFILTNGGGLVGMAIAQLIAKTFGWAFEIWQARKLAKKLTLRLASVTKERLRALAGFGGPSIVIQVCRFMSDRAPMYVLGYFLGVGPVAYYNVARLLVTYAFLVIENSARALTPRMTRSAEGQDPSELRDLFLKGSRLTATVSGVLPACLFAFGPAFLALWMGPEFITGDTSSRSDIVLFGLLAANLPRFALAVSWHLMFALAEVRFPMWISLAEVTANLGLSIWLVQPFGVPGILAATVIPLYAAFIGFLGPYSLRLVAVPFGEYVRVVLLRPAAAAALTAAVAFGVAWTAPPETWLAFGLETSLVGIISLGIAVFVGMTAQDRAGLLGRLPGR